MTFEELGLNDSLLKAIKKQGITTPTEIQTKAIPAIINGKDLLGESATGSGKTIAFGAGILQNARKDVLSGLIITPTREIAQQVSEVMTKLSKEHQTIAVYGGVGINPQIDALRTANVVVGTPGRLLDHIQRGTINLSKISYLVLDEADKMFEMGFIDDIRKIISKCPKNKQTLLFSATFSSQVRSIASTYMKDPIRIQGQKQVDPTKLTQFYYSVPKNLKFSLLVHLLKNEETDLTLVFCNTKRIVDVIAASLKEAGIKSRPVHGDLTQARRNQSIDDLKKNKVNVLVATDVAARGLDIPMVSHVYNYDIPNDPKDYVHRIGRTARAGADGKVINILARDDFDKFSRVMEENRNLKIDRIETPEVETTKVVQPKRRTDNFTTQKRSNENRNSNPKKFFSNRKFRGPSA